MKTKQGIGAFDRTPRNSIANQVQRSAKDWSWFRLVGQSILAATAWYLANFVMNVLNIVFFVTKAGERVDFGLIPYGHFWSDRIGWALYFGSWLSLTIPGAVIATLALFRIDFTWRLAAKIGLILVAAQLCAMGSAQVLRYHHALLQPSYLIYYAARFWIDLPGVFVAAAAWRIDLDRDLSSA